jgi:pimeloyl-ACP methyl ester carboxylesterase
LPITLSQTARCADLSAVGARRDLLRAMIRPMEPTNWSRIVASDGRHLEVLSLGRTDAMPVLFHGGTPTAAVVYPPAAVAVTRHAIRVITYSRPGYATSDPQPGRCVADAVADVEAILDAIQADRFVTIGWSGGGPHALACAALASDRCLAAATIAGVAPYPAPGLDWLAGMGRENVEEFGAALAGIDALSAYLTAAAGDLANVTADRVAATLGGLVSDVDVASLRGPYADWAATTFRKSVSTGIDGWRDDDMAFVRPWAFDLTMIRRPVAVWQGDQDCMVPFAHGEWLAAHLPTAQPHLLAGQGHLSLAFDAFDEIVEDLLDLAK